MAYRIHLYEDDTSHPCLVWEIDSGLVRRMGLEDAARLSAHMRRMLLLSAGAEDVARCAADAVGGRQATLRVTVLASSATSTADEVQRQRRRLEFLEAGVSRYRDEISRLTLENLDIQTRAAGAEERATQAEIDARAAREAADKRVEKALAGEKAAWNALEMANVELRAAKDQARRLQDNLDDAEAEIARLRG